LTKKSSKRGFDSDSESDDSEFSGKKKGKLARRNSKKNLDSDDSDSGRDGKKRGKLARRNSKKNLDSDDSDSGREGKKKGKLTRRNSKKNLDSDDSDTDRGGKKKGKLARRNSKNSLVDSDSDSSQDSERNKKKKKNNKGGSRRGHSDSESESSDSDEGFSKNRNKKQPKRGKAVDESVRQARTILTSYSTTKDQDISSQVQAAMKTEMTDVISTMKAQREEMEERLRVAEKAALALREEQESSKQQITELETKKKETEERLHETQKEAKMVRSNSCLELAEKEGEKIIVSAELEGVRKEREKMSKMIENLEQAKQDMEGRLTQATEEATTLKAQNEESTKRVSEVEKDREKMKLKLTQLQRTRGTIESRLKEAEEEGKQLKEEHKEKTKQIKRCNNDDGIHQYQSQKNTISRELKKLETEREEMMTMLARLDKSCENVQGQIGVSRHDIGGRRVTSNRPSHANNRQPSVQDERPKDNKSGSWLAKDILNRSQHGIEGGDRARDSRPLNRSKHGIEGGDRSRDSRPLNRSKHGIEQEWGHQSLPVTARPAGWLGDEISNRSFHGLSPMDREPEACDSRIATKKKRSKDPSVDPSFSSESANLQIKREKHRATERRLQKAISKGKLN
jgi:hypothetical protein